MADIFELFKQISAGRGGAAPTGPVEYIVAGLGNPGAKYENSRHNVGFLALEQIAKKRGFRLDKLRFRALTGECMVGDRRVLFLKPETFMNLSGQSVIEAMRYYKLPPERLLVVHDDISLAPGRLRIRKSGSDGGHNGLKNIIYLGGSNAFARVKIGVGAKPHPDYDLAAWVLATPEAEDRAKIEQAILKVNDIVELFVQQKLDEAMNRYHQK